VRADTIFALSSGRPPAALAVIRISGPQAHRAGEALAGRLPEARRAALRSLRAANGSLLDQALVLRFDAPSSATGEPAVEFHCHGGRAVVDSVLATLEELEGLRPALPGEFTRRAFGNGRIDLTEAEGLADLLQAETEAQRRAALGLAGGALRRQVDRWREGVLQLAARAEAAIDYEEEAEGAGDGLHRDCAALATELERWLEQPRVEPLRDGVRIVVAGPPNVGKSSLLNALAGEERSIVTDFPGTTRDHVAVHLAIDGMPMVLTDTAGLRDADDPVERIGVERARTLAEAADILLWLGEPGEAPEHPQRVLLLPKADLVPPGTSENGERLRVSSLTREGLEALLREVARRAAALLPGEDGLALNRRQAAHLQDARGSLVAAAGQRDPVLRAEDLREARLAFDRLSGRAGVEDLLDAVFGRFCLGK
jgi:tRNA modification GTPase